MLDHTTVPAGTELMRQGDVGENLMFLMGGTAAVTVNRDQIKMLGSGSFFGELALLPDIGGSDGRRTASVIVTETSEIAVCERQVFELVMRDYPRLGGQILAQAFAITAS